MIRIPQTLFESVADDDTVLIENLSDVQFKEKVDGEQRVFVAVEIVMQSGARLVDPTLLEKLERLSKVTSSSHAFLTTALKHGGSGVPRSDLEDFLVLNKSNNSPFVVAYAAADDHNSHLRYIEDLLPVGWTVKIIHYDQMRSIQRAVESGAPMIDMVAQSSDVNSHCKNSDNPSAGYWKPHSKPHFHIVEITDPIAIELIRRRDHKQLPPNIEGRLLHVFITANVDGQPVSITCDSQSWYLDPVQWEFLGVDDCIGFSGPWDKAPGFIRDEFSHHESGEFFIPIENVKTAEL